MSIDSMIFFIALFASFLYLFLAFPIYFHIIAASISVVSYLFLVFNTKIFAKYY